MEQCEEELVDALDATDFFSIEDKYSHADELKF